MKTDDVGATKLMRACQVGDLGAVLSMLAKGDDVNITDRNNNTALMYAIINEDRGSVDRGIIINKLLAKESAVDVDASNMQFETAAILAAKNNDPITLEMLLQRGAKNLEMIDTVEGKNVYDYAKTNSCMVVMDEFKNNQLPVAEPTPARRSFLTRVLDVLWSPFKLIGNVLKAIVGAIVQMFIDRSAKPRSDSDPTDGSEDLSEDQEMFANPDNPQTPTKLTSKPEQTAVKKPAPVEAKKGWFDWSKEKKPATRFTTEQIAENNLLSNPQIRGVTPPGSPKKNNQQEI